MIQETLTKHITNWKKYNQTSTNETTEFLKTTYQLTRKYQTTPKPRRGRPTTTLPDILLSLLIHTYTCRSSRRSNGELKLAKQLGLLQQQPHFTILMKYMNSKEITKILNELIIRTSEPLSHLETDLAADASGFTTNRYHEWRKYKYGRHYGKNKNWIKAHILVGTKTKTVVSAIITKGKVSDCTQLPLLINSMSGEFVPKRISADKAYHARYNIDAISRVGAEPFIPFKSNTNPKGSSRGSQGWKTSLKTFYENPDYFYKHYHQRSLSETVFSMVKRKFGTVVRCKRFDSQVNEVLLKLVCHNVCVLNKIRNINK